MLRSSCFLEVGTTGPRQGGTEQGGERLYPVLAVEFGTMFLDTFKETRRRKSAFEICLLHLKGYISMVISKVVTRGWREGIKLF